MKLSAKQAYAAAAISGALLWLGTTLASGRREAWDSSLYWTVAYPIGIAIAAVLGYLAPIRPARWGLAVMLAQAVTMAALAREFGLLPLGLILFAFLSVPLIGGAAVAALVRRRGGRL